MAIDPVCGMTVDPKTAAATTEYQGKTYYFCAPGCRAQFQRDPKRYAGKEGAGESEHRSHHG
jgi:Cu+-exporting ATPase